MSEPRLIDANALRKESKMLYSIHAFEPVEAYTQDQIDDAPIIDAVPVVHTEWVKDHDTIKCNHCGFGMFPTQYFFKNGKFTSANSIDYRPNYCPNCGARMDKPVAGNPATKPVKSP